MYSAVVIALSSSPFMAMAFSVVVPEAGIATDVPEADVLVGLLPSVV